MSIAQAPIAPSVPVTTPQTTAPPATAPPTVIPAPIDLKNVQGDILSGLPKKTQYYVFFEISDVPKFRKDLNQFIPLVKTVEDVLEDRKRIDEHKKSGSKSLIPLVGVNISFSHKGFVKMNIDDSSLVSTNLTAGQPDPFIIGQEKDATLNLGDANNGTSLNPDWNPAFLKDIHGLILISGESHASILKKKYEIETIFGVHSPHASIHEVTTIRGDVRPGDEAGHEHFGFLDGISNPVLIGFNDQGAPPGPAPVNVGVILTGHDGDLDAAKRAPWAVDGSFIAFRYLLQKVPEFNDFLKKNPITSVPGLTAAQGSELLGARLVGRWKSGAPIDISPNHDDPALGADPTRNNNFHFTGEINSQLKCPFAAHVRKTNPRADLESKGIDISSRRIMRRGIQFGPEVTQKEAEEAKTLHERGLLFACYQSNISSGFQFLQQSWANNPVFPPFETQPEKPGLDPIIGQGVRQMSGTDPNNEQGELTVPEFVVPRGGEYFFAPSLKGLKETVAVTASISSDT